ncbi:kinase-like protein [Myriangium duriaei CBS 260.36]|uniref:Kinase-like protein n=1 Tax=Myriangium duriaei CBS 260.36 TaxID=1168546 RepID=A0A9P4MGN5_9PEZI|nr:kinase-like protein [Myriangium duriaei CBS 260.36]
MSSFFRSASEVSESEDSAAYSNSRASVSQGYSRSARPVPRTNELATRTSTAAVGASQHHQNVLVHALLEDKCINDVCHELNAACPASSSRTYTRDDPEVKSQAAERYRLLTAELVSHGLISSGPEVDGFHHIRQTARDGLSLLSQQLNTLDLSNDNSQSGVGNQSLLKQPLRRLLTNYADPNGDPALEGPSTAPLSHSSNLHLASQLLPSHPLLDSTRYVRDFEEVCMLGKGGYGSVFRVSHRLDGRSYAVKKISLGPAVLSRVQENGEGELNAILSELRTMARLEHPNIVRYFGGWVEWSKDATPAASSYTDQGRLITEGSSAPSTTDPSTSSLQRVVFQDSLDASIDNGILFEDSISAHAGAQDPTSLASPVPDARPQTPSTLATVVDEIEEISRRPSSIRPSVSTSDAKPNFRPGPSLTLHIQMSLYPLTLAQYLSPSFSSPLSLEDSTLTLQHCFHAPASLRIFSAVLSGIAHLHAHSIIHRDIKPANIFLSPSLCAPSLAPHGSVDPLSCADCLASQTAPASWPETSDCAALRLGVCVGDFGLVTDVRSATTAGGGVGTALYRPPERTVTGQGLDMYALGIVLVELLTKFDTRSERLDVLSRLRGEGSFPVTMKGKDMRGVRGLVEKLLAAGGGKEDEVSCESVRGWVEQLGL